MQIGQWKKQLLDGLEGLFENGASGRRLDPEKLQAELYEQIGWLQMELAWVKKNLEVDARDRRGWVWAVPASTATVNRRGSPTRISG